MKGSVKKIVQVENVTKIYGRTKQEETKALNHLSFDIYEGEFVGIMGASGSGKTTLLNLLSTLDSPTSGTVQINGKDLTQLHGNKLANFRSKQIGFIFQDFNLLENLTAFENIAIPLSLQRKHHRDITEAIEKVAKILNIQDILKKFPSQLSGGQKQRVASARALVTKPSILLGDEPTGSLDSKSAYDLLNRMKTINQEFGVSILMVTHDPFSASFCTRILFIKDGKLYKEIKKKTNRQKFYEELLNQLGKLEDEKN
ncbi:ABC transporter ATP-binding protein [Melissococcus plutonius]|uniref:ABC transporter, ATP-binding protein n=1 Tax=Melissococcus plutonius TaxID=33970 RepID=A0A2Z5Y0A6_9ENTE|nr:ABC transporter ATP-binding protein [Melissococcus plutonius]BAL61392.1 ABC transporter ATPase component [Melissococcus plutonius DAT561]MCV2498793.1 ABC transporter ATP-binding protein [Melissococcus plutonius]MCV2501029.1 ABC transporter ATP-binding protein [Melissococcus plutonius]MCV2504929.1 ABC transporter ATP-binding protein [Melissococcus plutonius]MCV2507409.1 ABC transporter ATP-binding protein [Melissococcus plutonius]